MEKLAAYLSTSMISQRAFAQQLGIHQSVVSRFLSGAALPSLDTAFRMEAITGGAVPASCWVKTRDQKSEDAA